jgi:3-keto-5-aminohexanoate cleavage enzyme
VTAPAVLTCAVSGGSVTGNPNQPTTRDEVVAAALGAAEAGASVVHIHARAEGGGVSQTAEDYAAIRDAIRGTGSDIVINFTTGGSWGMSFDERRQSLAARPDAASLNAGSINFGADGEIYENPKRYIDAFAEEMARAGILPEYECFDLGMAVTAAGMVTEHPGVIHFVLGVIGGAPPTVETMCHFASLVPDGTPWMATAIGRHNFPMMAAVLARGGHVRTGLEDVVYMSRGQYAESNRQLVERARVLCEAVGRPVATPEQAREIYGIGAFGGG